MLHKSLLAALFALPLSAAAAQTYTNHWPQLARTELDFVHKTLQENHPGAVDAQNPGFKKWLERGYAEALAQANQATSIEDMKRVLKRYAAGFADGHLQIGFNQESVAVKWPGMVIGKTNSRYFVSGLAKSWPAPLPALNAELLSCDGRSPDTMMNEDILPGLFNLPSLDSVKGMFMRHFFLDNELAPHQYRDCVFADAAGRKQYPLKWDAISRAGYSQQWRAANPLLGKRSTISQIAPGKFWVHLPEFEPGQDQEAELKALIAEVPKLRSAELVVFDLRNNDGGSSQWGADALANLYGAPYMDYLEAKQGDQGYAEYRASKGNLRHIEDYLATSVRQFGADSPSVADDIGLVARMRKALADGVPYVRQTPETAPKALPATAPAPLSGARAMLVTDSNCASACLDFADAVLRLPNVRHVGQTTGADTLFMAVRHIDLPSKLGTLVMAQKVYRGRPRANNQPWVPHLQYPGPIADTDKLKAWVLETL